MIKLEVLTNRSIFEDNPELKSIWPQPSSQFMQEATIENFGEKNLFVIKEGDKVIGLTGYFLYEGDCVALRWHGILESHRGLGYSRPIIEAVARMAKEDYPESRYLVEWVPLTNYSAKIVGHFESIGFERFGPIESEDWTPHLLQGYRAELDKLVVKKRLKP